MEKEKLTFIKNFNPIWFATVLGFGGIALATIHMARFFNIGWLKPVTAILAYGNLALCLFLFALWILRAVLNYSVMVSDLSHPVFAGFHSLMPAALVMVSLNFSKIGSVVPLCNHGGIAIVFWAAGALFEVVLLTLTCYYLVNNQTISINNVNGGWLVPPVAALLTALAGLGMMPFVTDTWTLTVVLWVNFFFFGNGAFIMLLITIFLFYRLFFSEKILPQLFSSVWILLVPFSLISLLFPMLADAMSLLFPKYGFAFTGIAMVMSPVMTAIGLWLLVLLIMMTYHYMTFVKLPFGLSWWAFVFPTASLSIACLSYSLVANQPLFGYAGAVVYFFLLAVTAVVIIRTILYYLRNH